MLATGTTIRAAAKALGVAKSTVQKWSNDPEVIATRRSIEKSSMSRARSILADRAPEAAQRLALLMQSEKPDIAAKAAVDLLKFAEKADEAEMVPLAEAMKATHQIFAAIEIVFGDESDSMLRFFQELQRLREEGNVMAAAATNYEADDDVIDSPSPATKTKTGDE